MIIEVPYVYQAQLILPQKRKSEMFNVVSYIFLEVDDIKYVFDSPIFNIKGLISNSIIERQGERRIYKYNDNNVMQLLKGNNLKYTNRIKDLFNYKDEIDCFENMNVFLSMTYLSPDLSISNKLVSEDSTLFQKAKNITNNKNIILSHVTKIFKNDIKLINDCFYITNPIPCLEFDICNSISKRSLLYSKMKYFIYYKNCLNINNSISNPSIFYPLYSDLKEKIDVIKEKTWFYGNPFIRETEDIHFENYINNDIINTYLLKKSLNYYVNFLIKTNDSFFNNKGIYGFTSITKNNQEMKNFFCLMKQVYEKNIINIDDMQMLRNTFYSLMLKYFPKEYDLLTNKRVNLKKHYYNNDTFNKLETLFMFFNGINTMFLKKEQLDTVFKNI